CPRAGARAAAATSIGIGLWGARTFCPAAIRARTQTTPRPAMAPLCRRIRGNARVQAPPGGRVAASAAVSPITYPRVDRGVKHVHHQVDQHVAHSHEQHDSLNEREVLVQDGVDQQTADSRAAEYRLDD